jgi:hypothetical protein
MFRIAIEPSSKLVIVHMAGFMTVEEVSEFSRQEQVTVAHMGCRSGEFLLLINTDDAVIQSQEVVAAFRQIILGSALRAKRIAVVRHDALTRMQTRRILAERSDTAIFGTMEEAQAWLLA